MNPPPISWPPSVRLFWMIFGGAICFIWGVALLARLQPPEGQLNDFVQEWTSAQNFWHNEPIYDDLVNSVPRYMGIEYAYVDGVRYNAHPPSSILLALPFARFDFHQATGLWNLMSFAALAAAVYLLMGKHGLDFPGIALLPVAAFLLTSNSLHQQVNQAQFNLILLLMFVGIFIAQRQGQWATAGILLGCATAIKIFPGFLIVFFVAQRRWKAVLFSAAAFMVVTTITAGILGWQPYWSYVVDVLPQVGKFRDWWPNASITGYWSKLFDGSSGHVIPIAHLPLLAKTGALITVLTVAGLTAWKCAVATAQNEKDRAFCVCIVAMLLVSPITWDHYFLILLIPFAFSWRFAEPRARNRFAICALAIALCTFFPKRFWDLAIAGDGELADGPGMIPSVATGWQILTVLAYQTYGLVLLLIFTARCRLVPAAEKSPSLHSADKPISVAPERVIRTHTVPPISHESAS